MRQSAESRIFVPKSIENKQIIQQNMKIALIGYGKMGHMIEDIAKKRGHEIVSIIDVNNVNDFDSDAFRSAEVAIEFTNPTAAYGNLQKAWAQGVKVVSGSTGWLAAHETELKAACANEGKTLLWASNFSLGVAIFGAVNKYLAHIMNQFPDYDVTMTETHHVHKLDAPSGTAITLAEQIVDRMGRKKTWVKGEVLEAKKMLPKHCALMPSAATKCLVFTLSSTILQPIASASRTMRIRVKASPSVLFLLLNMWLSTKVGSLLMTFSTSSI